MDAKGSFGGHLGVRWVTFWGLWTSFWLLWSALGVLWESQGSPGTSLGGSGAISGIFREIPGGLLATFWVYFCFSFAFLFGRSFLVDFWSDFASTLVSFGWFLDSFLVLSQVGEKYCTT